MTTKLSEHNMLVTLATMALKMDDLTGHDVLESFRALGHEAVVTEAREQIRANRTGELLFPREWPQHMKESFAELVADKARLGPPSDKSDDPLDRYLSRRVFEDRLNDLVIGLSFLSGTPLHLEKTDPWHGKPKNPLSALKRAGRIFR